MNTSDLRVGDLRLYRDIGRVPGFMALDIGARLIGVPNEYIHCGLITGFDAIGRPLEISAYTDSGVKIGPPYPFPSDVYRFKDGDLEKLIRHVESRVGAPYGWDGLAWLAFVRRCGGRKWWNRDDSRPFCSHVIAAGAIWGGCIAQDRYACEYAPGDFAALATFAGPWQP